MEGSPRHDESFSGPLPGGRVRIFLIDNSPIIRMGVRAIVGSAGGLEIVGAADDPAVFPDGIRDLAPDIIIVDSLSLSKEQLERVSDLLDRTSRLLFHILVIVGGQDSPSSSRAWADGTVPLQVRAEEFAAVINLVASGYSVAAPKPGLEPAGSAPPTGSAPLTGSGERPAGPTHWDTIARLTQREIDVLRAVAQGRTNAEIARFMTISESTVKSHVQNMLAKLGLPNRASAVALAYEAGIIGTG